MAAPNRTVDRYRSVDADQLTIVARGGAVARNRAPRVRIRAIGPLQPSFRAIAEAARVGGEITRGIRVVEFANLCVALCMPTGAPVGAHRFATGPRNLPADRDAWLR